MHSKAVVMLRDPRSLPLSSWYQHHQRQMVARLWPLEQRMLPGCIRKLANLNKQRNRLPGNPAARRLCLGRRSKAPPIRRLALPKRSFMGHRRGGAAQPLHSKGRRLVWEEHRQCLPRQLSPRLLLASQREPKVAIQVAPPWLPLPC